MTRRHDLQIVPTSRRSGTRRAYPMEMHLVHQSAEGTLAVVGVLIEEGPHHGGFNPLWTALPQESGANRHLEDLSVDLDALLPPRDPY